MEKEKALKKLRDYPSVPQDIILTRVARLEAWYEAERATGFFRDGMCNRHDMSELHEVTADDLPSQSLKSFHQTSKSLHFLCPPDMNLTRFNPE